MRDRIAFWWKALRLGASQLNTTAGWIGTIVLALGVVGVVVPLVLHLSAWLVAVVLVSLLALVLAEGGHRVWRATDTERVARLTERDTARNEIAQRFDRQRYALSFDGIDSSTLLVPHATTGTVELQLRMANNSDDMLRFEIESISVAIQGKKSDDNTPVLNRSDIISPHGSVLYIAPTVDGVRFPWGQGTLEVKVKYGNPAGPMRFRTTRRFALRAYQVADAPPGQRHHVMADLLGEPEVEDIQLSYTYRKFSGADGDAASAARVDRAPLVGADGRAQRTGRSVHGIQIRNFCAQEPRSAA